VTERFGKAFRSRSDGNGNESAVTLATLFISMVVLFVLGIPIAFAIGMSSLIAILVDGDIPLTLLTQRMFFGLDSWLMMSIPLSSCRGN